MPEDKSDTGSNGIEQTGGKSISVTARLLPPLDISCGVREISVILSPGATLEELCLQLSEICPSICLAGTNKLRPGLNIMVNGIHYRGLEAGLNTRLEDGDELTVFYMIGGGARSKKRGPL